MLSGSILPAPPEQRGASTRCPGKSLPPAGQRVDGVTPAPRDSITPAASMPVTTGCGVLLPSLVPSRRTHVTKIDTTDFHLYSATCCVGQRTLQHTHTSGPPVCVKATACMASSSTFPLYEAPAVYVARDREVKSNITTHTWKRRLTPATHWGMMPASTLQKALHICQTKEIIVPVPGTTLTSLRPLIQGTNGVAVFSHPAAAMAGLDILRRGGNAIDAGVAVGLALNVVHAHECNFLGVAPTIMYLADRREVVTRARRSRRLAAGRLSRLLSAASSRQAPGWNFAGSDPRSRRRVVHRARPVWHYAFCRSQRRPLAWLITVFPRIAISPPPSRTPRKLCCRPAPPSSAAGAPAQARAVVYQKDLAATLCQLVAVEEAHRGQGRLQALQAARDVVYKGELAEKIVAFCQAEGGLLTMADLAAYHVRCEPPVTVNYRGYDVYATGPRARGQSSRRP